MMKRTTLPLASLAVCLLFWLLELVTLEMVPEPERPFGVAMHATALTVMVFALSAGRTKYLLVLGLVVSLALWTMKLFTTEATYRYEREGGESGVIWRGTPALHNHVYVHALPGDPSPRYITLFWPQCSAGFVSKRYYDWLTRYGYAWSTALSIMLFTAWLRSQRVPLQAALGPRSPGTVYRD